MSRRALGVVLAFLVITPAAVAAAAADSPAPPPMPCTGKNLFDEAQRSHPAQYQAILDAMRHIPNAEGLLWKIEKPDIAPSYLFGTIHVTDERAIEAARAAGPYLATTHVIATELGDAFSPAAKAAMAIKLALRLMGNKTTVASLITSPDDRERIGKMVRQLHTDPDAALRMPPWLLATLLSVPACEWERQRQSLPIVDQEIADLGGSHGEKLVGLETIDEQFDAISSLDPNALARAIVLMARTDNFAADSFATMIGLYAERRIGAILPTIQATQQLSPEDLEANRAFMLALVDKRNKVMDQRAKPLIEAGGAFIAVGALHLVGEQGLVELLRRDGYTLTRIW